MYSLLPAEYWLGGFHSVQGVTRSIVVLCNPNLKGPYEWGQRNRWWKGGDNRKEFSRDPGWVLNFLWIQNVLSSSCPLLDFFSSSILGFITIFECFAIICKFKFPPFLLLYIVFNRYSLIGNFVLKKKEEKRDILKKKIPVLILEKLTLIYIQIVFFIN